MVHPGREVLSGIVEAGETYVGAPREGKTGRGAYGKRPVFVAVERKGNGIGRIRMQCIADASSGSLQAAVIGNVAPGAVLRTDRWNGYNRMGQTTGERRFTIWTRRWRIVPCPNASL